MNIFEAVEAGDCDLILSNISQINHINGAGYTPVLVAVQKRQLNVVKVLLENGADTEATNKNGYTALHVAIKQGRLEIVTLLLDHGADIEARDKEGCNALYLAVIENQFLIAKLHLQRGANVNTANNFGNTPLICAAYNGLEDLVKLLLQHGADHSLGTLPNDNTALYWACKQGHHTIAKMLLDAGANSFHKSQNGNNMLSAGKDESMKRLIREYQRVDGPSWLVRELSLHGLEWSVVCDTQDKLRKISINCKDSLAYSQLSDACLRNVGIDNVKVRHALLQIYYTVNGSFWLLQELNKRVAQWYVVRDVLSRLRQAGLDSRESLARIPSAKFTDAYLQGIGIDSLTVRCAVLEMRAHATWLGARLASEGVTVANLFLSENFVYNTLGCSSEESVAALSESEIQTSHLPISARQRLLDLHKQLVSEHRLAPASPRTVRAAPIVASVPAAVTTSRTSTQNTAPVNPSASFVPRTETEDRVMRDTVVKVQNAGMSEVNGDYHFSHVHSNAGVYTRRGQCAGKMMEFAVHFNSYYTWHISAFDAPGRVDNQHFLYSAPAQPHDIVPPSRGIWQGVPRAVARGPAPSVTCVLPMPVPQHQPKQREEGVLGDQKEAEDAGDTLEQESPSEADSDSDEDRPTHESLPPLKRSRLAGDCSLPHSDSDSDGDAAGDMEDEFMMVRGQE